MAKQKTKTTATKRTKTFTEGERWSIFFTKGDLRNRVRAFPSGDSYKVSVSKANKGVTTDRSVETFSSLSDAKDHVAELTLSATENGWKMKLGVLGNNSELFA